jgi:hypothetical protein
VEGSIRSCGCGKLSSRCWVAIEVDCQPEESFQCLILFNDRAMVCQSTVLRASQADACLTHLAHRQLVITRTCFEFDGSAAPFCWGVHCLLKPLQTRSILNLEVLGPWPPVKVDGASEYSVDSVIAYVS